MQVFSYMLRSIELFECFLFTQDENRVIFRKDRLRRDFSRKLFAFLEGQDIDMVVFADIQITNGLADPGLGNGHFTNGVILADDEVFKEGIRAVAQGCQKGRLLFRVDRDVSTAAAQEFFMNPPGGTGYDKLSAQVLEECRRFHRALEIITDGHQANIKIGNPQGFEEAFVRTVRNEAVRRIGQHFLYPFF